MATMTSLVALSIDAMLPALPQMGQDLGVANENDRQLVVSVLFLGLAIGTFVYGPVSDTTGRKKPIYVGILLFIAGTLICMFASDFNVMLFGRLLQGIGAAGPRIVSIALIRDIYAGRAMAKIMSLVMVVFILVPALAPLLGQAVMLLGGWRAIFVMFLLLALLILVWFGLRQTETLTREKRKPFALKSIGHAVLVVIKNPIALGYTLSSGFVFGAFIGYLSSSQQILQELYELGERFPVFFAVIALFLGLASYVNSTLVMKFGMRNLSRLALGGICVFSSGFLIYALVSGGQPPLWSLMVYLGATFFCVGMLFGNFNALALEPQELGEIAGVASAVVGSLSTLIALVLGGLIGKFYDGSVIPLVSGFAVLGLITALTMMLAEKRRYH
ncbi:MAG: multidrug effflux MFS transporter [Gammaproteobacteria bacterium]|nr:multidrug effflux MFS transporter [Gammaproteobacteria bacterium]